MELASDICEGLFQNLLDPVLMRKDYMIVVFIPYYGGKYFIAFACITLFIIYSNCSPIIRDVQHQNRLS